MQISNLRSENPAGSQKQLEVREIWASNSLKFNKLHQSGPVGCITPKLRQIPIYDFV